MERNKLFSRKQKWKQRETTELKISTTNLGRLQRAFSSSFINGRQPQPQLPQQPQPVEDQSNENSMELSECVSVKSAPQRNRAITVQSARSHLVVGQQEEKTPLLHNILRLRCFLFCFRERQMSYKEDTYFDDRYNLQERPFYVEDPDMDLLEATKRMSREVSEISDIEERVRHEQEKQSTRSAKQANQSIHSVTEGSQHGSQPFSVFTEEVNTVSSGLKRGRNFENTATGDRRMEDSLIKHPSGAEWIEPLVSSSTISRKEKHGSKRSSWILGNRKSNMQRRSRNYDPRSISRKARQFPEAAPPLSCPSEEVQKLQALLLTEEKPSKTRPSRKASFFASIGQRRKRRNVATQKRMQLEAPVAPSKALHQVDVMPSSDAVPSQNPGDSPTRSNTTDFSSSQSKRADTRRAPMPPSEEEKEEKPLDFSYSSRFPNLSKRDEHEHRAISASLLMYKRGRALRKNFFLLRNKTIKGSFRSLFSEKEEEEEEQEAACETESSADKWTIMFCAVKKSYYFYNSATTEKRADVPPKYNGSLWVHRFSPRAGQKVYYNVVSGEERTANPDDAKYDGL